MQNKQPERRKQAMGKNEPIDVKFGTSGVRGLVSDLAGPVAQAYIRAFVDVLKADHSVQDNQLVLVGRDLRASSVNIAADCMGALVASRMAPLDCGTLPTPALAHEARQCQCPAIMITGSHIADDRNGIKFYSPIGEITKTDERAITQKLVFAARNRPYQAAPVATRAVDNFVARCISLCQPDALSGLTIGVYEHSAVGRDMVCNILAQMGATIHRFGRSDSFVPVDTEALRVDDEALLRDRASRHQWDAIVSTDGDSDRPLICDETGAFVRGDMIGTLTAQWLRAETIVTPVTSNSAIETQGGFDHVVRTRVGSPHVIQAMESTPGTVVGFEANGGTLLGTGLQRNGTTIHALPTRDAFLPIIATLATIAQRKTPLSQIVARLGFNARVSSLLRSVSPEQSARFLAKLSIQAKAFDRFGGISTCDSTDGHKLTMADKTVIHYRQSGNAPELRCYVEAANDTLARDALKFGLAYARTHLNTTGE